MHSHTKNQVLCPVFLLADAPAESPESVPELEEFNAAFKGAVNTLVHLLRPGGGGRVIGLTGEWGTGKSTLVLRLKKALQEEDLHTKRDTAFWIFDTWTHEDDPLRRAFLTQLTHDAVEKKWLCLSDVYASPTNESPKTWERALRAVRGYERQVITTTNTQLSSIGSIIALATLFTPLGAILFTKALDDTTFLLNQESPIAWQTIISLGLMLSPAMIVAIMIIKNRFCDFRDSSKPWQKAFGAVMAFMTRSSDGITTSATSTDGDQTTIEFSEYFNHLLGHILDEDHPERQLVLVVDNIDRLDEERQAAVWRTLQIFFNNVSPRSWNSRLSVLIPVPPKKAKLRELEKSIQLRMSVPAPTLEDWKGLLKHYLIQVMPKHPPIDFIKVVNICTSRWEKEKTNITPRTITLFVNRLALLHAQYAHPEKREDAIPLLILTLAIFADELEGGFIDGLTKDKVLTQTDRTMLGTQTDIVLDQLAGIAFGTSPMRGAQLLLERKIENALNHGNTAALAELYKKNPAGFEHVFAMILPRVATFWKNEHPEKIATISRILQEARHLQALAGENFEEDATPLWPDENTVGILLNAAHDVQRWPLTRSVTSGLIDLFDKERDEILANKIIQGVLNASSGYQWSDQPHFPPTEAEFIDGYLDLIKYFRRNGKLVSMEFPRLSIGSGVAIMAAIGTHLLKRRGRPKTHMLPIVSEIMAFQCGNSSRDREDFLDRIENPISEGVFTKTHLEALVAVLEMHEGLEVSMIGLSCINRIPDLKFDDDSENVLIIRVLAVIISYEMKNISKFRRTYVKKLQEGSILNILLRLQSKNQWNLIAPLALTLYGIFSELSQNNFADEALNAYENLTTWLKTPSPQLIGSLTQLVTEAPVSLLLKTALKETPDGGPFLWENVIERSGPYVFDT